MSLAGVAAAVAIAAAGASSLPCGQGLCNAQALAPFFARITQVRSDGHPRATHILQIGDSHSAGDNIAGPWREALQAQYGDGGRGVLPPGHPYDGFFPRGVHVDQSPGWRVENTLHASAELEPVLGISGFRLTAEKDGASLTLTAEPAQAFRRLTVCAEMQPGAGAYVVTLGAVTAKVDLNAPLRRVDCESFAVGAPQTVVSLVAQGGPVTLTSWGTFTDGGGVVVSNLGVVGVQLRHFARTDDQAVGEELRAYQPDLIVLEFGVNEAFAGPFNGEAYASLLRSQIERVQRLSGGVPILVIGAPDAATNRPDLARFADPAMMAEPIDANPVGGWYSPPSLAQIRSVQRRVALAQGAAYWDWGGRMGGSGAAADWAAQTPPLVRPDRVHTTKEGGARIAAMLQADLAQAMAQTAP